MAKKEIVTLEDIEQDISNSLKEYKEMSGSTHKKLAIPASILGAILGIVSVFYLKLPLYLLIVISIAIPVSITVEYLLNRKKRKNFRIDDYEITTEVLAHKIEDTYTVTYRRYHHETVRIFTLYFENGKSWRIPEDNYLWCEERPMSEFAVYQSSHRGNVFIVAVKKDTGEIAMAYNTEFFEYKKRRLSYE